MTAEGGQLQPPRAISMAMGREPSKAFEEHLERHKLSPDEPHL